MPGSYYDILGVPEDADDDAIRKAYLDAVTEHHPDVNDSAAMATTATHDINAALDVLTDPLKRRRYDERLRKNRQSSSNSDTGMAVFQPQAPPETPPAPPKQRPLRTASRAKRPSSVPPVVWAIVTSLVLGCIGIGVIIASRENPQETSDSDPKSITAVPRSNPAAPDSPKQDTVDRGSPDARQLRPNSSANSAFGEKPSPNPRGGTTVPPNQKAPHEPADPFDFENAIKFLTTPDFLGLEFKRDTDTMWYSVKSTPAITSITIYNTPLGDCELEVKLPEDEDVRGVRMGRYGLNWEKPSDVQNFQRFPEVAVRFSAGRISSVMWDGEIVPPKPRLSQPPKPQVDPLVQNTPAANSHFFGRPVHPELQELIAGYKREGTTVQQSAATAKLVNRLSRQLKSRKFAIWFQIDDATGEQVSGVYLWGPPVVTEGGVPRELVPPIEQVLDSTGAGFNLFRLKGPISLGSKVIPNRVRIEKGDWIRQIGVCRVGPTDDGVPRGSSFYRIATLRRTNPPMSIYFGNYTKQYFSADQVKEMMK